MHVLYSRWLDVVVEPGTNCISVCPAEAQWPSSTVVLLNKQWSCSTEIGAVIGHDKQSQFTIAE